MEGRKEGRKEERKEIDKCIVFFDRLIKRFQSLKLNVLT